MSFFKTNLFTNIVIALLIILFCTIISSAVAYILIKMFHFKIKDKNKIKNHAFYKPIKSFVIILGIYIATSFFDIPENIKLIIMKAFKICIIILVAKGFASLFDSNSASFNKIKSKLNFKGNNSLINFSSKILKALVYIVAGFIIISEFGYDLSSLVAGLGISSVVIALAAQDTAKSLLGGLCIALDKPFNIGDSIRINNYEGTVEDMTLRTTRIRTSAKDIVIIPNSEISSASIINSSRKDTRLYNLLLTLELSTPLEKVANFKENLILLLNSNEYILKDTIKIYFDTISMNGIDLKISFYTSIIDYNEFLNFKENINFAILDLTKKNNIELAYDTKTIYVKNNGD